MDVPESIEHLYNTYKQYMDGNVNLEMVRIKRRGEKHMGVEMFMQGGKYGVMYDGDITCPAVFEHIKRISDGYFALATYPYNIYGNKVTGTAPA